MKINLNLDSLALILYCSDLIPTNIPILNSEEWNHVEALLKKEDSSPSRLIGMNIDTLTQIMGIEYHIAEKLLDRQKLLPDLFHSLHNLENESFNVTTKYEDNYPECLFSLKDRMPPVLYYAGDLGLIKDNNISIVGPHVTDRKLNYAMKQIIKKCLDEKRTLVTHGTKGVDEYATKLMLKENGNVIMFVADHMLDKRIQYKKLIDKNRFLLLSAVDPYAYFNVTNSLDRNIYVCGLVSQQFVLATHINSGSVWFTAVQNLHYKWTQLLVVGTDNYYNGNLRLIEMGAIPVNRDDLTYPLTIDQIVERHQKVIDENTPDVDQMSIYEFIEEE